LLRFSALKLQGSHKNLMLGLSDMLYTRRAYKTVLVNAN
jgi:hypothetical protein